MKFVRYAGVVAMLAAGSWIQAEEGAKTAVEALSPTEIAEAGEKVQKITFLQDDAQFNIVSKIYELKHTKAADLAPFVKSAAVRFDPVSTVGRLEDRANRRQVLIVSTAQDMMPYIDEMIAALDRPGAMNEHGSNIAGTGIAYGTYEPQFRSSSEMRKVIVAGQVSSGVLDSRVRLDRKSNLFYFKDTPYRVSEIKQKLEWLDRPIPQARIELKIYEIRDSDLRDIGIDYLAWKNGPGLNLFEAGYEALNMKVAETIFNQMTQSGVDLFGNFTYGFGGMYTAPAFDLSFVRLLQQNGKATINSSATLTVSNLQNREFKASFSPEYQNILKDEDHRASIDVGGNASLEALFGDIIITGGDKGVVNFNYELNGSNVVERNNLGAEISENTRVAAAVALGLKEEKLLTSWKRTSQVEQTIGIPFLCELPVLKYIFGTTTSNDEVTHYFVTAVAHPVSLDAGLDGGMLSEFDELVKK